VVAVLAGSLDAAQAADERAVRGSAIAAAKCGRCHAVGATDDSPHKITPQLRDLKERYPIPMLVDGLASGSLAGHDEMPQFDLGPDGVGDLLAYIDSLNPAGPHYLGKSR
jgi:mono/diheme cytochrome c family protein